MLIKIDPKNPNLEKIKQVTNCLKNGGIIIYPSDTIYGIGCDIFQKNAIEKIARIKGVKVKKNNFSFICANLSHLSNYTKQIDNPTYKLMKRNLPGPFTFILNANNNIPRLFKNNKKTIGIRIPDHLIPIEIVNQLGNPILTTSVKHDDTILEHMINPELIYEKFKNMVDMVIDAGYGGKTPSTIVDCTNHNHQIIREGKGALIF